MIPIHTSSPRFGLAAHDADNACPLAVQPDEAPSGMMARGHYEAISQFIDDDKQKHLQFDWSFDIKKDWD